MICKSIRTLIYEGWHCQTDIISLALTVLLCVTNGRKRGLSVHRQWKDRLMTGLFSTAPLTSLLHPSPPPSNPHLSYPLTLSLCLWGPFKHKKANSWSDCGKILKGS